MADAVEIGQELLGDGLERSRAVGGGGGGDGEDILRPDVVAEVVAGVHNVWGGEEVMQRRAEGRFEGGGVWVRTQAVARMVVARVWRSPAGISGRSR